MNVDGRFYFVDYDYLIFFMFGLKLSMYYVEDFV